MLRSKETGALRGFIRILFCCGTLMGLALMPIPAKAQKKVANKAKFCSQLGKTIQASSGAQMYCFGPQKNGLGVAPQAKLRSPASGLPNVDAANRGEDRTNSGVYIGGQSETSIAAAGNYVVEAWNDGSGFYNSCGAPNYKEELTGFGFSSDGGKSFTDLGGLPNVNCSNGTRWSGDPSVGTYSNSGFTYFYISSLYSCNLFPGCPTAGLPIGGVAVALSACQVTGGSLSCGQPIVVATGNCNGATNTNLTSCFPFLDKDYLAVDPARKRLYVSFTDFTSSYNGTTFTSLNQIELAACDLDNPMAPVCSNGTSYGQPYVAVQPTDPNGCELEGAYPAVRASRGDVYVGYEYNWFTNFSGLPYCVNSASTSVVITRIPSSCLPDPDTTRVSMCAPPFNQNSNIIISTDATVVPGYNRFAMNDFPRIAVSEPYHSVSLVWNDARDTPLGDILLQSYDLDSLNYIQGSPVQLNSDYGFEDMHTMPGLKNASSDGLINVTWYDRRGKNAGTGKTDVYGALNVNPRTASTPANNVRITNESTDWLATFSVIVPNFGDYTDNFVSASNTLFVAWSDGRSGVPQPYEAHVGVY